MTKILLILLLVSACASAKPKLENMCLDGHEYYYSRDYLAPKMDDDGKPIKCKD